jgi:hydrogenase nickel incorporation protein HypA/HybF
VSSEREEAQMHEFGYAEDVLAAALKRAQGRPVAGVGVRLGVLHRVSEESLQQAFEIVAAGTPAAAATVRVATVRVRATCTGCGRTFEADDPAPPCTQCGTPDAEFQGGDEFLLEWLRYHEDPATAQDSEIASGDRSGDRSSASSRDV